MTMMKRAGTKRSGLRRASVLAACLAAAACSHAGRSASVPDESVGDLSAAASTLRAPAEARWTITEDGLGPVRADMQLRTALDAVRATWPDATISDPEPFIVDFNAFVVSDPKGPFLYLGFEEWSGPNLSEPVVFVATYDERFRTQDGVGPGSLIADAQTIWGAPTFSFSYDNESRESALFPGAPESLWLRPSGPLGEAEDAPDFGFAGAYGDLSSGSSFETDRYKPGAFIEAIFVSL